MIKFINQKIAYLKRKYALRWVRDMGLCAVKIEVRAETAYLVSKDGQYRKIGGKNV